MVVVVVVGLWEGVMEGGMTDLTISIRVDRDALVACLCVASWIPPSLTLIRSFLSSVSSISLYAHPSSGRDSIIHLGHGAGAVYASFW